MSGWKQEWDRERFSDREKQDLAARLRQAAEQEESMDNKSKKRIFRLGRGAAVAVAAALMLTVGAMAAAANGTWGGLFRFFSPEEETLLEKITCEVGQTRQADDWEVTLSRCAGDDEMVYIWVDMKAPADFTGEPPADYLDLSTYWDLMIDGVQQKGGGGMISIDWDEESRTVTYCSGWPTGDPVAGRTADIILEPLCWSGWDREAEKWVDIPLWEGDVTFEDVELAYENQTIRLEPNVEVPYLDGTATLTRLDISPFRAVARVEGGSCYRHHWVKAEEGYQPEQGETVESEAGTITVGGSNIGKTELDGYRPSYGTLDCWGALTVEFHMKDGTVIEPRTAVLSECEDGFETADRTYAGECYVERRMEYETTPIYDMPDRIIDPAQVDYVTVCGVDIPVAQE